MNHTIDDNYYPCLVLFSGTLGGHTKYSKSLPAFLSLFNREALFSSNSIFYSRASTNREMVEPVQRVSIYVRESRKKKRY